MSKVLSALGEVVDFGKLKIQHDIEEAKSNPRIATKQGRVSTLDPSKLGMGLTLPVIEEGVAVSFTDSAADEAKSKIKRL